MDYIVFVFGKKSDGCFLFQLQTSKGQQSYDTVYETDMQCTDVCNGCMYRCMYVTGECTDVCNGHAMYRILHGISHKF